MGKTKGIIFAIIAAVSFGLIPCFSVPLLKAGMNAQSILFYRNFFCFIIIAIICLVTRKSFRLPKGVFYKFIILSVLYVISSVLLVYSYNYIASGLATTIHYIYPIGVAVAMALFFKEKKPWIVYVVAVLALIGVGLLCYNGKVTVDLLGALLSFITVITYAAYIVYLNRVTGTHKIDNLVLMFYLLLIHSILFAALCFCTKGIKPIPNTSAWLNTLGLAIISSVVSTFALLLAIKNVGPTITSILGSLETVISMAVGMLYFGEVYHLNSYIGLVLIIISVIVVVLTNKKKVTPNPKHLE